MSTSKSLLLHSNERRQAIKKKRKKEIGSVSDGAKLSAVENERQRRAGEWGRGSGGEGAILARGSEKASGKATFKRRLKGVKEKV